MAIVFYALMAGVAVIGASLADLDLLVWHDAFHTTTTFDATLGIGVGVTVVIISAVLEKYAEWARRLSAAFGELLGSLSMGQVTVFAVTSALGEELLFRGFLQQWLSDGLFDGPMSDWLGLIVASTIFGLIHVGPDRKTFLPWTIMALVMGFAMGGMYLYTGNLLAPILTHFTINLLNIAQIAQKHSQGKQR